MVIQPISLQGLPNSIYLLYKQLCLQVYANKKHYLCLEIKGNIIRLYLFIIWLSYYPPSSSLNFLKKSRVLPLFKNWIFHSCTLYFKTCLSYTYFIDRLVFLRLLSYAEPLSFSTYMTLQKLLTCFGAPAPGACRSSETPGRSLCQPINVSLKYV